jgi:3-hydroxyacyl-CoA dehydrogenase
MEIKNIFIVGAGTMGAGIAQTTAVSVKPQQYPIIRSH